MELKQPQFMKRYIGTTKYTLGDETFYIGDINPTTGEDKDWERIVLECNTLYEERKRYYERKRLKTLEKKLNLPSRLPMPRMTRRHKELLKLYIQWPRKKKL